MWKHPSQNRLLFDSVLQLKAPFLLCEYVKYTFWDMPEKLNLHVEAGFFFSVNVYRSLFEVKECRILTAERFDICLWSELLCLLI